MGFLSCAILHQTGAPARARAHEQGHPRKDLGRHGVKPGPLGARAHRHPRVVGLRHAQPLVLVDVHWLNDERKVEEPTLKTLLDRIRVTREQLDGNARMNAMHLDKRIRDQMHRTRLSGTDANETKGLSLCLPLSHSERIAEQLADACDGATVGEGGAPRQLLAWAR